MTTGYIGCDVRLLSRKCPQFSSAQPSEVSRFSCQLKCTCNVSQVEKFVQSLLHSLSFLALVLLILLSVIYLVKHRLLIICCSDVSSFFQQYLNYWTKRLSVFLRSDYPSTVRCIFCSKHPIYHSSRLIILSGNYFIELQYFK